MSTTDTEIAARVATLEAQMLLVKQHLSNAGHPLPDTDAAPALRTDGPTLKEYVAAGYKAENYPPEGYAAVPEPPAP